MLLTGKHRPVLAEQDRRKLASQISHRMFAVEIAPIDGGFSLFTLNLLILCASLSLS